MSAIFKDEFRNARKHYKCDATELFHCAGMWPHDLNADEKLILEAAEANKGKILRASDTVTCAAFTRATCSPSGRAAVWTQSASTTSFTRNNDEHHANNNQH